MNPNRLTIEKRERNGTLLAGVAAATFIGSVLVGVGYEAKEHIVDPITHVLDTPGSNLGQLPNMAPPANHDNNPLG